MIPIAEWARRGYPGSVNGTTGKVNGVPPYDNWRTTPAKPRTLCSVPVCDLYAAVRGRCWRHYEVQRQREIKRQSLGKRYPIPQAPYIKLADR